MDKNHRCKFCSRNFSNGKALGGHMRSHMMKGKSALLEQEDDQFDDLFEYTSNQDEEDDSYKKGNQESSVLIPDGESESGPFRKRARESVTGYDDCYPDDCYSVKKSRKEFVDDEYTGSDVSVEEHMAHCLIMLSRDHRRVSRGGGGATGVARRARKKHTCEECGKVFGSYQALGGHKASHRKVKVNTAAGRVVNVDTAERIHKCPFCHRIFSSGQALGGHKRSHFISGTWSPAATSTVGSTTEGGGLILDIDLNLPAPLDDDDYSQNAAASALTDESNE